MVKQSKVRMYEYKGEWHPISYYARQIGVNPNRLRDFVRNGYSLEDAMERAKKPPVHRRLTVNGVERSISEWSFLTGVDRQTITDRMDKGYPPELCLYQGNLNTYKKESGYGEFSFDKLGNVPVTEEARTAWEKKITDDMKKRAGKQTMFRVRWCDRTSHSHTWREDMVGLYDLDAFMESHYLSKVVVNW